METQPEQSIELIPMEADFKHALEARYRVPFGKNVIVMTIVLVLIYILILAGSNSDAHDGLIRMSERNGDRSLIKTISFNTGLTVVFILLYIRMYKRYAQMNRHYLLDARFGFIFRERMIITKVFPTPAGINIYWLDHPAINTFTPDPYRHFRVGDSVNIYYLRYASEYLAYEV